VGILALDQQPKWFGKTMGWCYPVWSDSAPPTVKLNHRLLGVVP